MAVYSASKGGVLALSAAMAYDFLHHRIRVNTVIPGGGGIVTGMSLGRVGGDRVAASARARRGTAAGRVATGDDIANVVAFLLSPEAETIVRNRDRCRLLRAAGRPDAGKASALTGRTRP